jgi:hypothetical protein
MATLKTPTNQLVSSYVKKFAMEERYYLADQAITNLFEKFPENKVLEDILLKISIINDLYSTNIFATFKMAEHIKKSKIDEGLLRGDADIVGKIASGHGVLLKQTGRGRNFYSFATKYCNWHNKDAYPIYDQFVANLLVVYRDRDQFSEFTKDDLKDFKRFKSIILDFKKHYNLTQHNLKEIDKFLWIYGKELKSSR